MGLTVVICTKNEEKNIARCLQSVTAVADEIIVFDSMSTDQTKSICESFEKVKFHQTEWLGFSQTKNKANQLATQAYILSLDADEVLSENAQREISQIKNNFSGLYRINRMTNYCGKWIKHSGWFPDKHIRIFPKLESTWSGDYVHEKLVNNQNLAVHDIKGLVYHYSVTSIADHLRKIKTYSELGAKQLVVKKKKFIYISLFINPVVKFLRHYVFKRGFLDGYEGLIIAALSAYSVYLKYSKAIKLKGTSVS